MYKAKWIVWKMITKFKQKFDKSSWDSWSFFHRGLCTHFSYSRLIRTFMTVVSVHSTLVNPTSFYGWLLKFSLVAGLITFPLSVIRHLLPRTVRFSVCTPTHVHNQISRCNAKRPRPDNPPRVGQPAIVRDFISAESLPTLSLLLTPLPFVMSRG